MTLLKLSKITLALGLIATSSNVFAGAAAGGASEPTQILNNTQLIQQVITAYDQLEEVKKQFVIMQQQAQGLENVLITTTDFISMYKQVSDVMKQGNTLAYTASNITEKFNERFKDFEHYAKSIGLKETADTKKYSEWVKQNLDTSMAVLRNANLQNKHFDTELRAIKEIEYQSKTAIGQKQLIQATNELLALLSTQMISLRQMIAADSQARTQFEARATEQKAYETAKYFKSIEGKAGEVEDQIFSSDKSIKDGI